MKNEEKEILEARIIIDVDLNKRQLEDLISYCCKKNISLRGVKVTNDFMQLNYCSDRRTD